MGSGQAITQALQLRLSQRHLVSELCAMMVPMALDGKVVRNKKSRKLNLT